MKDDLLKVLKKYIPSLKCEKASQKYLEEPRRKFRGTSSVIAFPKTALEISELIKFCNIHQIAVVPFGGGTGLVGGQVYSDDCPSVIISLEKMIDIQVDTTSSTMRVMAGASLQSARDAAKKEGLLFPLSLASQGSCTIGGNLATNAGGVQVLKYGSMRDLCLSIDAVFPDGEVLRGSVGLRKDNTGYDLKNLLIGSEGTLGIITSAVLKLYPQPRVKETALVSVASPTDALHLLDMVRKQFEPVLTAFELIGEQGLLFIKENKFEVQLPTVKAKWWVLIELAGPKQLLKKSQIEEALANWYKHTPNSEILIAQNSKQSEEFWKIRETIPLANRAVGAIASHDISLPLNVIPTFLSKMENSIYSTWPALRINCFGHLGDGNLHFNIFPPISEMREKYVCDAEKMTKMVFDQVVALGGSISAEHGIGRLRVRELSCYGDKTKLKAMKRIKRALDPNNIMNPGVLFED